MGEALNILFLGGAKRVEVARLFKQAAAELGRKARLFSYELSAQVPVACEATIVQGTRWGAPDVQEHLHKVVRDYGIKVIVPFVDGAVEVAATYAAAHDGDVFVPTGPAESARLMFDKVMAAKAFEDACVPIPATYRAGDPCLRLIAKPRHGSASQGIVEINSIEALETVMLRGDDYLIQERIANRVELTVDCYASVRTGEVLAVSPRVRTATSGGEVSDTVTIDNPQAVALATKVIEHFGLRGAVTVQLIFDSTNPSRLMLMEVNPRLGGGVVCSIAAGAHMPKLILAEALGQTPAHVTPRPGVRVCRYPASVIFHAASPQVQTF